MGAVSPLHGVVVLDTCILISNVLRYLCFALAKQGLYQPIWSAKIRDEWLRNASRLWSVPVEQLALDWDEWEHQYPLADQGIVKTWEQGLQYSDPKDWHVIAAARAAQARFQTRYVHVLTRNSKDFNRSELRRLALSRWEPDGFLCVLWDEGGADWSKLLEAMPAAVTAPDKPLLSVTALLKRERLFNLAKRYESRENT